MSSARTSYSPGLGGVEHGAHQHGRVELRAGGVRGHRGVDVADVHADDVHAGGGEFEAEGVRRGPQGGLGGAVDAGDGVPAQGRVDVDDRRLVLRRQDRSERAGEEEGAEEVRLDVRADLLVACG